MFEEWKSGEYIRIVRNPNYWRGEQYPLIDEMVWQFIPDQTARFNAMQSGDYHIGQIEATQVANFNTRLVQGGHFLVKLLAIETVDVGEDSDRAERLAFGRKDDHLVPFD